MAVLCKIEKKCKKNKPMCSHEMIGLGALIIIGVYALMLVLA